MTTRDGRQPKATGRIAILIAGAVLFLGGCGGDDAVSGATEPDTPATTTATTSAPSDTPAPTDPSTADVPELGGTDWVLTAYVLPGGSITNPWPDTEITLRFDSGGRLTGSGGCNTYEARYAVEGPYDPFESGIRDANDGQMIRIDSLAYTEMGCTPDRLMEQETEFLDLLPRAGRWVLISEGGFSLRTAEGALLLEAAPAS